MAASAGPGAPVRQVEVLDIEREHSAELAAFFQQVGQAAWKHPSRRPGRGAQIRVACWRWERSLVRLSVCRRYCVGLELL